MKHTYTLFIAGFLLLMASACNIINPAEPVPSYVHIEKINLSTTYSPEGSNSSKIADAWVYMDGSLLGCFELPVTFPVIGTGTHSFTIKPGIKVNGIAATRAPYPFFNSYDKTITLTAGETTTLTPTVTYLSSLPWSTFWMEDFESPGTSLDTSPTPGVNVGLVHVTRPTAGPPSGDVFEGTGSCACYLNATDHNYAEIFNTDYVTLPRGESPVFLELNYKCNYPFTVGVFSISSATSAKSSIINLHSTNDEWNKVYIYVTPAVTATAANSYSVFIGMLNNDGFTNPYFIVDNLKLIHF